MSKLISSCRVHSLHKDNGLQVKQKRKLRKRHDFLHYLVVRAKPGRKNCGTLQAGKIRLPCALGRSGISAFKREGDGATPYGVMRILSGFRKKNPKPLLQCRIPLTRVRADDGWCDAVDDPNYNRPVRLPYGKSAETMERKDRLYNIGFVLDWNIRPRKKNCGSAIFFHLARPGFLPTEGCIALQPRDMERLLPYLSHHTKLIVSR